MKKYNYCPKCGEGLEELVKFCPKCGFNLKESMVSEKKQKKNGGGWAFLFLIGFGLLAVGIALIVGTPIAAMMQGPMESGGRVWAIGALIWSIFVPTGLINFSFIAGIISLAIGIGLMKISD